MRKLLALAVSLTASLMAAAPAMAEGETVKVTSVTCSGVTVEGGGYTEGQDLTVVAKAPRAKGAITDLVTVAAGDQGSLGPVTLKFGGQVPDGTYELRRRIAPSVSIRDLDVATSAIDLHGGMSGELECRDDVGTQGRDQGGASWPP
jgi:hypothetical protein